MTRADILRQVALRYHAGDITLAEYRRAVEQWRPKADGAGAAMPDGVELHVVDDLDNR